MKLLIQIAKQLVLLIAAMLLCALLMPARLDTFFMALRSIFAQDYYAFTYAFTRFNVLLFLLLRVLPLLLSAFLVVRFLFKKRGWLKGRSAVLFQLLLYFLALASIETYFRTKGYQPGSFYMGFGPVKQLVAEDAVISDSLGINKLNPACNCAPVKDYAVNPQGFRSRYDYTTAAIDSLKKDGKKVVMFIGDSHTEGWSAKPVTNSFTDLIDKQQHYHALNFGIVGTDPLQYKLVAEKFVPQLMPDAVVVICCANDMPETGRLPTPGIPIWFKTNAGGDAGFLASQKPLWMGYKPNDVFKNAQQAYDFYVANFTMVSPAASWFQKLCGRLVITTRLYAGYTGKNYQQVDWTKMPHDIYTNHKNLWAIKELCHAQNIPVIFWFIPDYFNFGLTAEQLRDKYKQQLDSLNVSYFMQYDMNLWAGKTDPHLNNNGHRILANMLTAQLDSVFRAEEFGRAMSKIPLQP